MIAFIFQQHDKLYNSTLKTLIDTTLLIDVGFHNRTMRCWEFSLNTSLVAQLFEHLTVIL
jgi:hypothetical protein